MAAPTDQPPDIRCVSVDANGDVLLSWEHLATAQSSTIYNVYSSTNINGPYTLLDTVGYPSKTYSHTGAGADAGSVHYYLTSESDCAGVSDPSDTLKSIKLDVTAISSATIGDLLWNELHVPPLTTSATDYNIFAIDGSGNWANVGATPGTNFQFPAQTCGTYQAFYVALDDASGCVSNSSIDGTNLEDIIPPTTPAIDVVSVNSSNKSVISWIPSSSTDVVMYYIDVLSPFSGWNTIDSVAAQQLLILIMLQMQLLIPNLFKLEQETVVGCLVVIV